MDLKELKEKGKELGIPHAHVMGEEKLKAAIAQKEAEMAPKEPEDAPEEPQVAPVDPDNPDKEGLAERQELAHVMARLKALEEANIAKDEKIRHQATAMAHMESVMRTIPSRSIPERPNPNYMVYHESQVKDGKYFGKQVSPEEAEHLYKQGYVTTPADLPEIKK